MSNNIQAGIAAIIVSLMFVVLWYLSEPNAPDWAVTIGSGIISQVVYWPSLILHKIEHLEDKL